MNKKISPSVYNKKYLLSENLEGYEDFVAGSISRVKKIQIKLLRVSSKTNLLEVGLGRGELLLECAKRGARVCGIDYSKDAIKIAKKTLSKYPRSKVLLADSRKLPFADNLYNRVFCGDVIEHMSFDDATTSIKEIYRVLKKGGFALIHTSPNQIFIKYVYTLLKFPLRIFFRQTYLGMEKTMKMRKKVHVYEYNFFTLMKLAKKSGLKKYNVWIEKDLLRSGAHRHTKNLHDSGVGQLASILGQYWLVRLFFGNDLYLRFEKK